MIHHMTQQHKSDNLYLQVLLFIALTNYSITSDTLTHDQDLFCFPRVLLPDHDTPEQRLTPCIGILVPNEHYYRLFYESLRIANKLDYMGYFAAHHFLWQIKRCA